MRVPMKLYAERPARLVAQVAGDVAAVAWSAGWVWLALQVHDRLDALRQPTVRVGRASDGIANALTDTGDQVRNLQFVGDVLAAPFDAIAEGARELVTASDNGQAAIGSLADLMIPVIALLPVLFAVAVWLALRGRWIRRATGASRLRSSEQGVVLLAAQALTSPRLDRVTGELGDGHPFDDTRSLRALAGHQLRGLGLRVPRDRPALDRGDADADVVG